MSMKISVSVGWIGPETSARKFDIQLPFDDLRARARHEKEHEHENYIDHRRNLKTDIAIL